jgi:CRISPR-associated exonuclease Cas4
MMGDRDYRSLIQNAIDSIGKELEPELDVKDIKTIHLHETVRCLRRSYYDRIDPLQINRTTFSDLLSGLLRKLKHGSEPGEFVLEDLKLKGQADMIVDDAVMIFRSAKELPENPLSSDVLFLNACLWIFNKGDGILVYLTGERKEISFSLTKNRKMFEEVVRRVRVLSDLLKEQKVPILEPSEECSACQYYERCYVNKKMGKSISIKDLVGMNK